MPSQKSLCGSLKCINLRMRECVTQVATSQHKWLQVTVARAALKGREGPTGTAVFDFTATLLLCRGREHATFAPPGPKGRAPQGHPRAATLALAPQSSKERRLKGPASHYTRLRTWGQPGTGGVRCQRMPVVFFPGMAGHPCPTLRAVSLSLQGAAANIGK